MCCLFLSSPVYSCFNSMLQHYAAGRANKWDNNRQNLHTLRIVHFFYAVMNGFSLAAMRRICTARRIVISTTSFLPQSTQVAASPWRVRGEAISVRQLAGRMDCCLWGKSVGFALIDRLSCRRSPLAAQCYLDLGGGGKKWCSAVDELQGGE